MDFKGLWRIKNGDFAFISAVDGVAAGRILNLKGDILFPLVYWDMKGKELSGNEEYDLVERKRDLGYCGDPFIKKQEWPNVTV